MGDETHIPLDGQETESLPHHVSMCHVRYKLLHKRMEDVFRRVSRIEYYIIIGLVAVIGAMGWIIDILLKMKGVN